MFKVSLDKEIKMGEAGVFRRRMGIAGWAVSLLGFMMSGFEFFNLQTDHLWALLGTSSGLMGIGIAKNIWGNNNNRSGNGGRTYGDSRKPDDGNIHYYGDQNKNE